LHEEGRQLAFSSGITGIMKDIEVLRRVTEEPDFMRRMLLDDRLDDWELAKAWAEFALRIDPEDLVHLAVLVRSCRHLGDKKGAIVALEKCTDLISRGIFGEVEQEVVVPMVEEERRLLRSHSS
jgi:hypothetical protein